VNVRARAALLALAAGACARAQRAPDAPLTLSTPNGLRLVVDDATASPTLRLLLPDRPDSDRTIVILFPEHVTAKRFDSSVAEQLVRWRPGATGERPAWRRSHDALEYDLELPDSVRFWARASLDSDGVRFRYTFTSRNRSSMAMIYAVTDPRMTSIFQDRRLERTYVHYSSGIALIAAESPERLTEPLDRWLPARYLASYTWPVPRARVERSTDGVTYYTASKPVDAPFIATVSSDSVWVAASFARTVGNVWTNPELTCQHVDPQVALPAGATVATETKLLLIRGSLNDAFARMRRQSDSLR
jgi:hypothetical protein